MRDLGPMPTAHEWDNLRNSYMNVVDNFYKAFQHHNRSGALVHDILNKSMNLRERLRSLDDWYHREGLDEVSHRMWLIFKTQLVDDIGKLAEIVGRAQS